MELLFLESALLVLGVNSADYAEEYFQRNRLWPLRRHRGGFQDNGTPTKHCCLESSLVRMIATTNSSKHVITALQDDKLRILTSNSMWPRSSGLWKKWDEGCVPADLRCKYKPAQGHVWWIECSAQGLGIIFDNSPFSFAFIFNAIFSLPLIYNEMLKCPLSSVELYWTECSKGLFIVLLWQLFINFDVLTTGKNVRVK